MGGLDRCPLSGFIQRNVHAPQLLQKEFAGPRGTFIACDNIGDAPGPVQNIDHKGFAAGRNDCRTMNPRGFDIWICIFDGFRLGNGCQVYKLAKFTPGGSDSVKCAQIQLFNGFE